MNDDKQIGELIRNIGFVGDTTELAHDIRIALDSPPKGCPCQRAEANGDMMMCMTCFDPEAAARYDQYQKGCKCQQWLEKHPGGMIKCEKCNDPEAKARYNGKS